jgi:hypothetical protein
MDLRSTVKGTTNVLLDKINNNPVIRVGPTRFRSPNLTLPSHTCSEIVRGYLLRVGGLSLRNGFKPGHTRSRAMSGR